MRSLPLCTISSARGLFSHSVQTALYESEVWPPLTWPITSASASSTTCSSISPEPGIEGPPVWIVLCIPCLRAHATIRAASSPALTEPSPTSPSSFTPAAAISAKSLSVIPFSITGAPASTFTPPPTPAARIPSNARCAVIASAFTPVTSLGRPGRCTSPAEIIVVTPPFMHDSIQPSWFCRGVQSPNTGCTCESISPGASAVPRQSITRRGLSQSQSACLPTAAISPSSTTIVSASRIGASMSPESIRPTLRITTLPDDSVAAVTAICALLLLALAARDRRAPCGRSLRPRR